MRLLRTNIRRSSFAKLEEFYDNYNLPPYAILSHRWAQRDEDEVLYKDLHKPDIAATPGYSKIVSACARAIRDGLKYIWIDTCCINRDSSAELSEAINSMFAWYERAQVCYAYLEDVAVFDAGDQGLYHLMAHSQWFTRGWTLQELLAPERVIFFSTEWLHLGDKTSLAPEISQITSVHEKFLLDRSLIPTASIAQRMSWAACRHTKRREDVAYCLMGIFDVNMPLLYGEGDKSFIRLQEEIMKSSEDQSLFAWADTSAEWSEVFGLLATNPAVFKDSGAIVPYTNWQESPPAALTAKGLQCSLRLQKNEFGNVFAALECPEPSSCEGFLAVYLKEVSPKRFVRILAKSLCTMQSSTERLEMVHVLQNPRRRQEVISKPLVLPKHEFGIVATPNSTGYVLTHVATFHTDRHMVVSSQILSGVDVAHQMSRTLRAPINKRIAEVSVAMIFTHQCLASIIVLLGSMLDSRAGYEVLSRAQPYNDFTTADFAPLRSCYTPRELLKHQTTPTPEADMSMIWSRQEIKDSTLIYRVIVEIDSSKHRRHGSGHFLGTMLKDESRIIRSAERQEVQSTLVRDLARQDDSSDEDRAEEAVTNCDVIPSIIWSESSVFWEERCAFPDRGGYPSDRTLRVSKAT